MNFFEHFGIPVSYFVDKELIQKKFYELSRSLHPDRFQNESPEKIIDATRHFAELNLALTTLKTDIDRAYYLFELAGFKPEEKRGAPPPSLAEDYFTLQELLEEDDQSQEEKALAVKDFASKIKEHVLETEFKIETIFKNWEKAGKPLDVKALPFFEEANRALRERAYLTSMASDLEKKWR